MEKVPGWVEKLLIPTLESRVHLMVKEEVGHLEKIMLARLDGLEKTMDSRFEAVNTRIDSLEKRFPIVEELAEIKVRLAEVERRTATH